MTEETDGADESAPLLNDIHYSLTINPGTMPEGFLWLNY